MLGKSLRVFRRLVVSLVRHHDLVFVYGKALDHFTFEHTDLSPERQEKVLRTYPT